MKKYIIFLLQLGFLIFAFGDEMELKELQTEKGKWHYSVNNCGENAILFIHGANSSKKIWNHQFDLTISGYKSIFVDMLGYGESEQPEEGYNLSNWLSGLIAILEQEKVKKVCIVGHSNGVIIAKEFYRANPEMVSHLILLDGMLKPMIPEGILGWMKSTLERSDYKDFMESNIDRMPVQGLSEADIEILKEDARNTPKVVVSGEFEMISSPKTWEELTIKCPTTIIHANNPTWTDDYITWLKSAVPDHKLIQWDDSGHFIPMQFPDRLEEVIREALGE